MRVRSSPKGDRGKPGLEDTSLGTAALLNQGEYDEAGPRNSSDMGSGNDDSVGRRVTVFKAAEEPDAAAIASVVTQVSPGPTRETASYSEDANATSSGTSMQPLSISNGDLGDRNTWKERVRCVLCLYISSNLGSWMLCRFVLIENR